MPGWVLQGTSIVAPGGEVNMGLFIAVNQIVLIGFPDFPEGTRRFFGIMYWKYREASPANTIVRADQDTFVYHNATRKTFVNGAALGNVQFYCNEKFGSDLRVRAWLYNPV